MVSTKHRVLRHESRRTRPVALSEQSREHSQAPQTVNLDPDSLNVDASRFSEATAATEWAELRGRGVPPRGVSQQLLPGITPLRRIESGLGGAERQENAVRAQGTSTPRAMARGGRRYAVGVTPRSSGLRPTGFGENIIRPSLAAASRDWWTHRPVEHAAAGRSLDRSMEFLDGAPDEGEESPGTLARPTIGRVGSIGQSDEGVGPVDSVPARRRRAMQRRAGASEMRALDVDSYDEPSETPAWALRGRNGTAVRRYRG